MRIYFDSKDLINILEHSNPCTSNELKKYIINKKHKIVITSIIILEISEPLIMKSTKTNVMRLLNEIEKIPHVFINTANITRLELLNAIDAYYKKNEYKDIYPFVRRFDQTLEKYGKPPTEILLDYSMSKIVWDLYNEDALDGFDKYAVKLRTVFSDERNLQKKPSLKRIFINTIKKHLLLFKLTPSPKRVESFAEWIYKKPTRCPSIRLNYEVFHEMVKNIGDIPKDSDLEDLLHIQCLPYVDFMTVDRRFYAYVSQAAKNLNVSYDSKIRRSAKEILDLI